MRSTVLSLLFVAALVVATEAKPKLKAKNECVDNPVGKFAYDNAFRTYRDIATSKGKSACSSAPAIETAVLKKLQQCKATSPDRKIKETCCTKGVEYASSKWLPFELCGRKGSDCDADGTRYGVQVASEFCTPALPANFFAHVVSTEVKDKQCCLIMRDTCNAEAQRNIAKRLENNQVAIKDPAKFSVSVETFRDDLCFDPEVPPIVRGTYDAKQLYNAKDTLDLPNFSQVQGNCKSIINANAQCKLV